MEGKWLISSLFLLQNYQEQMISCSREILDAIEGIRRAAQSEPENLGHMVRTILYPGQQITLKK